MSSRTSVPRCVVAVDIGGTKIAAALVEATTQSHTQGDSDSTEFPRPTLVCEPQWTVPTPHTGGGDVAAAVTGVVRAVISYATDHGLTPTGVGIGSAGVIDAAGRTIVSATDAIPGWAGTPLADIVEDATGLPVRIENDVHAHARGEATHGAGAGHESTLMVAVGTGIGGAITAGADILRGSRGLAGHVGHIVAPSGTGRTCSCGCDGHLEAFASGPGMTRWFNDLGGDAENARDLENQAIAGNPLAVQVFADAARATGMIIAGLVNSLDPCVAILGGGLARAGDLYWQPLLDGYRQQLMPAVADTPLVPATLGSSAALLGAAQLVWNQAGE